MKVTVTKEDLDRALFELKARERFGNPMITDACLVAQAGNRQGFHTGVAGYEGKLVYNHDLSELVTMFDHREDEPLAIPMLEAALPLEIEIP
jgi:hypothetical protein